MPSAFLGLRPPMGPATAPRPLAYRRDWNLQRQPDINPRKFT